MLAATPDLRTRRWSRRALTSSILTAAACAALFLALLPLASVLASIARRGTEHWQASMLWSLPPSANEKVAGDSGTAYFGGFAGAMVGSAAMVGIAMLLAAPAGILAGVFLAEFGQKSPFAGAVRFGAKALSGLPSVLAGVVAYALVILNFRSYEPVAGAIALAVLMLPIITLQSEQALLMVHGGLREAALAAGATSWQAAWRVVFPSAKGGIMTGVLLAAARAVGETAPLLLTAGFAFGWMRNLREPAASLSVQIFKFTSVAYENQTANAWSTALALVVVVLGLNIAGRALARNRT